jgi:hypothetical protein
MEPERRYCAVIIGAIALLTVNRFCPLYSLLKFNEQRNEKFITGAEFSARFFPVIIQ